MAGWPIVAIAVVLLLAPTSPPILRVDTDHFTVNGRPAFLIFLSYFDGVRRQAAGGTDTDFAFLRGQVDGVRVLPNWWTYGCPSRSAGDTLIDVNGRIRPHVWADVEALLHSAAAHSLLVDLSLTRETGRCPGRRSVRDRCGTWCRSTSARRWRAPRPPAPRPGRFTRVSAST